MQLMILIREKEGMENRLLNNNMFNRLITTLIFIPIITYIIINDGILFNLLLSFTFILSCYEAIKIINKRVLMLWNTKVMWIIVIIIYLFLSFLSFKYCRLHNQGCLIIIILFFCIWVFDIAAYLIGILIKGPRLCPRISPKKTWSGLIGGVLAVFFLPQLVFDTMFTKIFISNFGLVTRYHFCLIGIVGQIGDLMQSYYKRQFNVKDSSNILPGHGGILDRLDSLYLSSILIYCILSSNLH